MLPNHSPLQIAEQFGTLESLFPGRIDLGLGRAPGTERNAEDQGQCCWFVHLGLRKKPRLWNLRPERQVGPKQLRGRYAPPAEILHGPRQPPCSRSEVT